MRATVLVPTHDHGPTLLRSIPSALSQTVAELEVLVVGDGVPDVTREIVAGLARDDERVRFFDNPKGPRHGELHRHAALAEARGSIVCYLSDDDLWLPEHVETMLELLDGHDFAHALPLRVETDGTLGSWIVDLALSFYRELLLSGHNRVPLPCAAHTLELYRRLPHGWRTTPPGIPTDLYMFQQILSVPDVRVVSGTRPTVLHFPSPDRPGWTLEERLEELDRFGGLTVEELVVRAVPALIAEGARLDAERSHSEGWALSLESWARDLEGALEGEVRRREDAERERDRLAATEAGLRAELDVLSRSVTWRLRARLVGLPVAGQALRAVARALARPTAR